MNPARDFTVLVCGGRDFKDYHAVAQTLVYFSPTRVVVGGCRGADQFAAQWARVFGVPCTEYVANWAKHGNAAGPIRNQTMLDETHPDLVVAFPGGRGTADMVRRAEKAGIKVHKWEPHI